jgi:Flp pilus assembly protein TadG
MARRRNSRRGAALVEFGLVGVVLIFIWICVVQMGIGAWRYHTLQYAVKMASAYMTTHGSDCSSGGNTCSIQIENAAQVLQNNAVGIPPSTISVTFTPYASDHVTAAGGAYPLTCTLNNCLTNTTAYPPAGFGSPGCDIRIQASFTFSPLMGMVVPGSGSVQFGTYTFTSDTQQAVMF